MAIDVQEAPQLYNSQFYSAVSLTGFLSSRYAPEEPGHPKREDSLRMGVRNTVRLRKELLKLISK